ncbi:MAG: ATP-binding protein [Dehalococcoidia bacterium]|nr:ATP-binding protein [Dehalococcoidia bacterium]
MTTEPEAAEIVRAEAEVEQTPVGRTSATERDPNTSDKFQFWLGPDIIVNPFDIVEVGQVSQEADHASKTYGLVTILEHRTDAPSHLANFISSNFGELSEEPNTPRTGTTIAKANVMSNNAGIYMPVPNERPVLFADSAGIEEALGIDQMVPRDRIPAGLIKMSNGVAAVAYIDRRYVLGPESAHVNISGISGLATKTSYAMFLIQSILQRAEDPSKIAVIIMNVKQGDLLHVDERGPDLSADQHELWERMQLEPKPFDQGTVTYLLPRGPTGQPNSFFPPDIYKIYAYDLDATADKLDLLMTDVSDPSGTMESIIGDIMMGLQSGQGDLANVHSWQNLLWGLPLFDPQDRQTRRWGDHHKASVGKFRRHLRRLVQTRQSGIFVDSRATNEHLLSDEIAKLRGGRVYVVDIAKLTDAEQTLVFGDLLRTVYTLKAEEAEDDQDREVPEKIIFFVDELNKYAPSGARTSPITEQVLDIAERGRSLGVTLISAQQFMSAVHSRVTGNSATKVIGRSGSAEVLQPDYRFLDDEVKLNVSRLAKGELLLTHAVYRQPVKVIFPMPAYKQQQI